MPRSELQDIFITGIRWQWGGRFGENRRIVTPVAYAVPLVILRHDAVVEACSLSSCYVEEGVDFIRKPLQFAAVQEELPSGSLFWEVGDPLVVTFSRRLLRVLQPLRNVLENIGRVIDNSGLPRCR
jgi:hypothetical protein